MSRLTGRLVIHFPGHGAGCAVDLLVLVSVVCRWWSMLVGVVRPGRALTPWRRPDLELSVARAGCTSHRPVSDEVPGGRGGRLTRPAAAVRMSSTSGPRRPPYQLSGSLTTAGTSWPDTSPDSPSGVPRKTST